MPEPGWVNGDAFARGLVEECPECGSLVYRDEPCEECGFAQGDESDALYDAYRDELAMAFYDDERED